MVSVILGGLGLERRVEPLSAKATVTPVSTSTLRPRVPEEVLVHENRLGGRREEPVMGGASQVPGAGHCGVLGTLYTAWAGRAERPSRQPSRLLQ